MEQLTIYARPNQGEVLLFDPEKSRKKSIRHCIFCETTFPLQNFKGKAVCSDCLENITSIFSEAYLPL